MPATHLIQMSDAGLDSSIPVSAVDEFGAIREQHIAAERPLTLYIDKREIVTLMTLGTHPELLILGWLRNQRLIDRPQRIRAIQVDWETESVAVTTHEGIDNLDGRLSRKTVTTGCGQGTVFGGLLDELDQIQLNPARVNQSKIYALLDNLNAHNEVYKRAGAVHGCALCRDTSVLHFVEDVGRHNAVDTLAGLMWLEDMRGDDLCFYTTGRLTSEMVMKVAQMGIPLLLSRSGLTQMGLDLARRLGVTLIARAKGKHFLVYHGAENIQFDAPPEPHPAANRRQAV